MDSGITSIAGIQIPSQDPVFLAIVAIHVVLGLACAISGVLAMLAVKGPGRHPKAGSVYYWALAALFVSATVLSVTRWAEDYHLFILGALAFGAAHLGRLARRRRSVQSLRLHIAMMGCSYVLLLTAFYVDNGKQLPLWRELPAWSYWALPTLVGAPLVIWAILRHPRVRVEGRASDLLATNRTTTTPHKP